MWRALKASLPRYGCAKSVYYARFYEYQYRRRFLQYKLTDFFKFLCSIAAQKLLGPTSEPDVYDLPDNEDELKYPDDEEDALFLGDLSNVRINADDVIIDIDGDGGDEDYDASNHSD